MSHTSMVQGPKPHAHSVWIYWGVFFALVLLTIATVELAHYDFGKFSIVVTLLIAGTKSLLVMGVFMHLAFDNKFLAVIAGSSFLFLALFILFPILDVGSRADIDSERANFLPRDEKVYKHHLDKPDDLPLGPGLQEEHKDKLIFIKPGQH
ncbi:MAG: cytochrome C oxidase subunit IV family protein [Myxococcales bacterium]|nr:cytochrome C oxidase subunit IV family protein [Myxococcales bacterium]USN50240.1 MAG: cytochrome C oxidase subunit IV family protein [Myxococcales bacterium]